MKNLSIRIKLIIIFIIIKVIPLLLIAFIVYEGVSKLEFNEKIYKHQDFYDLGAMLYEHIPVLGSLVKIIKTKAGK